LTQVTAIGAGANAILALRCCQMNGEFEDYWESRAV